MHAFDLYSLAVLLWPESSGILRRNAESKHPCLVPYFIYLFFEGQTHFNFKMGPNCRHKVLTYSEVFKNKLFLLISSSKLE